MSKEIILELTQKDYKDLSELLFWTVNCFDPSDDRKTKAVRLAKKFNKQRKEKMKIPVIRTCHPSGKEWLHFELGDVKKACELEGCDSEQIDCCLEEKTLCGSEGCSGCYLTLLNTLHKKPETKFLDSD